MGKEQLRSARQSQRLARGASTSTSRQQLLECQPALGRMASPELLSSDSTESAELDWRIAYSTAIRDAMMMGFTSCNFIAPSTEEANKEEMELCYIGADFARHGNSFELYWTQADIDSMLADDLL